MNLISKVPVNHRILLHLRTYQNYRNQFEVPFAITQMGIAEHIQVHRAAAARGLNTLKEMGLVISETKHVIRGNRNRKAYFLSMDGIIAAQEVEDNLLVSSIQIGGEREEHQHPVIIKEFLQSKDTELSLVEISNNLRNGIVSYEKDAPIETSHPEPPGGKDDHIQLTDNQGHYFRSANIPNPRYFIGRESQIHEITNLIEEGSTSVIVIQGIAGIGKSSLAARIASTVIESRHVFWIDLHPWTDVFGFAQGLLHRLEEGNENLDFDRKDFPTQTSDKIDTNGREPVREEHSLTAGGEGSDSPNTNLTNRNLNAEAYFETLLSRTELAMKSNRALIVIDDYHLADRTINNYLRGLVHRMRSLSNITLLMTTRTEPDFYDMRMVVSEKSVAEFKLMGLDFQEAYSLLTLLQRKISDADPKEPELSQLVDSVLDEDEVGDNNDGPIDIETATSQSIAKHLLSKEDFKAIYNKNFGHPFAIELISTMGEIKGKFDFNKFVNEEIFRELDFEELDLLKLCSVLRGPKMIQVMLTGDIGTPVNRSTLERLIRRNLLNSNNGELTMHGMIGDAVIRRMQDDELQTTHQRASSYYSKITRHFESDWERYEFDIKWDAGEERRFVLEELYHSISGGDVDHAVKLVLEWGDSYISHGDTEFYRTVKSIDINTVDRVIRPELLEIIGDAHAEFGMFEEAMESYIKGIDEMPGERDEEILDEGRIFRKIGEVQVDRGDLESGIQFKNKSLRIFKKRKDARKTAQLHNDIAIDHWKKGDHDIARSHFQKALEYLTKENEIDPLPRIYLNISQLESERGHLAEAEHHLDLSVKSSKDDGDKLDAYHWAGEYYLSHGNTEKALDNFLMCLNLATRGRDLRRVLRFTERISGIYIQRGDVLQAFTLLMKNLKQVESGSRFHNRWQFFSDHRSGTNDPDSNTAVEPISGSKFKAMSRSIPVESVRADNQPDGIRQEENPALLNNRGGGSGASEYEIQSQEKQRMMQDNYLFAKLCETTAGLSPDTNDPATSRSYLEKALMIYYNFKDHRKMGTTLLLLGSSFVNDELFEKALESYRDAYRVFGIVEDTKACAVALLNFTGTLERLQQQTSEHELITNKGVGPGGGGEYIAPGQVHAGDVGKSVDRDKIIELYQKVERLSIKADFNTGKTIARRRIMELKEIVQ